MLATLALLGSAHAFCGTYVGSAGTKLENTNSQVVMVHESGRTTLTLQNDYRGDPTEFALLVPVPAVVGEGDVRVVEPDVIGRVDAFSAPRLVSYAEPLPSGCGAEALTLDDEEGASGDGTGAEALADAVVVESAFAVGTYDVVVLSAEQSAGLFDWLDANGYAPPEGSEALIDEYIEAGVYFLAAKVRLEASGSGDNLPPLQIAYAADGMSLPLRLGTASSSGEQDLVVLAVTRAADGTVGIQNYAEATPPDECMWPSEGESFASYYDATFEEARAEAGGPSWVKEYAWAPYHCDPCTDTPLTDAELHDLGFTGAATDAYLTRLHLRYAPGDLDQDVVFYPSGIAEQSQIRYVEYDPELADQFDVCPNRRTSFVVLANQAGACRTTPSGTLVPVLLAGLLARRRATPRASSPR